MPNQDFLITFSVDGTSAIRMMEEIGQRATALEAQLNALGRGTGRGGRTSSGILNSLGLGPSAVGAANRSLSDLSRKVADFRTNLTVRGQVGLPERSAAAFETASIAARTLANSVGNTSAKYQTLINDSNAWANQAKVLSASTDQASQAFSRHTQRILEAIIIYEAFGRAVQAISSGIELVIDIDRESRRLEAVLNIDTTQGQQFISDLGAIASETVTPFEHLVSETDRMASAFLDVQDPIERYNKTLELAADAGKFTTVTQRDLGVEVNNLIAIMKQLNIPVEELDTFLGKVVTAGGNASTVIAGLSDALQISSRAAHAAGVDLDLLLASESAFLIETGRTGSEVGSTFNILFQRLGDPDVINNVDKITGGLLKMRDAAGAIRDPFQILADLNALISSKLLDPTQVKDVIAALAPPLQPQRQFDFLLILDQLKDLGPRFQEISQAGAGALDDLVAKINDALGPQFQKLVIDAQRAFVDLFGPGLLSGGQQLIDLIRLIGEALGALPPEVLTSIATFGSLLIAMKLVSFAGRGLGTLLGIGGLQGTFFKLGGTATATGTAMVATGAQFTLFGRAVFTAGGLVAGLISQLRILLPLVAVWMAIDFAAKIGEMQDALKGQIAGIAEGQNVQELKALRARIQAEIAADQGVNTSPLTGPPVLAPFETIIRGIGGAIGNASADAALRDSSAAIDKLIADLEAKGPGAVATLEDINKALGVDDSAAESVKEANDAYNKMIADSMAAANGIANMTNEQRIAADATNLLTSLVDEQGDALLKLNDRLREGKITQSEWVQGQDLINRAATAASQLVAAIGEDLRTMIPELAGAAEGSEGLAAALFDMFTTAGDNIDVIEAIVGQIVKQAGASSQATAFTNAWSDALGRQALMAQAAKGGISGIIGMMRIFSAGALGAAEATRLWINQLVKLAFLKITSGNIFGGLRDLMSIQSTLRLLSSFAPTPSTTTSSLINQLNNLTRSGTSSVFGTGGTGSTAGGFTQTPVVDIGELSASQITQLIAIATRLRNAIPGETAASKDSLVTLIKDAQFLQNVRGIDDRLLRIALEELTQQMEEANRLKQKENILQNLVVNTGPFSALASQPTTFGVGGTLASGTGLNFDPTKGNFTINVPIELQGLDPARLQTLVYNIIYKAIADALRL